MCCCYNADDDGPDTCLCRRERQEAQIAAASMEKAREDDEAFLDEVDTDDQEQQMEQGETTRTEKEEQQVQPTTAAAHPDPPVASGSGTDNNINNAHSVSEKQNKIVKPLVEINFVNCGSSANLHGAWSQLRNKPTNLSGAAMAAPNQNIGVSLIGHSESVNNAYHSISALRKSSLTNPSIMQGGRAERETSQIGSFAERGDGRLSLCHFRSVIEKTEHFH
jgi:hypothetical protein